MTIRPWGKEKTVNTTTFGSQENCVVAALTDGGYVVAWLDYSQGTSTVEYARFNALGVSVETRSFFGRPDRNSYDPHVAALSDGGSSLARLKLMNFKAGQLLQSADYLLLAGKIVSVEARHAALIRNLITPNSFADNTALDANASDMARKPADVLAIASAYLVTKIDASNLPV